MSFKETCPEWADYRAFKKSRVMKDDCESQFISDFESVVNSCSGLENLRSEVKHVGAAVKKEWRATYKNVSVLIAATDSSQLAGGSENEKTSVSVYTKCFWHTESGLDQSFDNHKDWFSNAPSSDEIMRMLDEESDPEHHGSATPAPVEDVEFW